MKGATLEELLEWASTVTDEVFAMADSTQWYLELHIATMAPKRSTLQPAVVAVRAAIGPQVYVNFDSTCDDVHLFCCGRKRFVVNV